MHDNDLRAIKLSSMVKAMPDDVEGVFKLLEMSGYHPCVAHEMLKTGRLDKKQISKALKLVNYNSGPAKLAIETGKFNVKEMFRILDLSSCHFIIACAMIRTGKLSIDEMFEALWRSNNKLAEIFYGIPAITEQVKQYQNQISKEDIKRRYSKFLKARKRGAQLLFRGRNISIRNWI